MTQPPYAHVGRPMHELVETYREQCTQKLSQHAKLTDSIYISSFEGLNLSKYIQARTEHYKYTHSNCKECPAMLRVANIILRDGYLTLKSAFIESFPTVEYNVTYARRRFLQMPLACIRVNYRAGVSECFLIETTQIPTTHLSNLSLKV